MTEATATRRREPIRDKIAVLHEVHEADGGFVTRLSLLDEQASGDTPKRAEFLADLIDWFDSLKPLVRQVETTAEYTQLSELAFRWQTALAQQLRHPLDVCEAMGLTPPSADLVALQRLSADEVQHELECIAYSAARNRKLSRLHQELEYLQNNNRALHERYPDSPDDALRDFAHAEAYLAEKVLSGKLRLADQLPVEAYAHLEGTWLQEVKRLMAYFRWLDAARSGREAGLSPERTYYDACQSLHDRLLNRKSKVSPKLFPRVARWLAQRYLRDERLNVHSGSPTHQLIENKARRAWQLTGRSDPDANWDTALQITRSFYEHIIPAVEDRCPTSLHAVLAALSPHEELGLGCELVNSLEAALAIEFLDPEDVREYAPQLGFYL